MADDLQVTPPRNFLGKFYPPRPDPEKCLARKRLVQDLARRCGKNKRALIIQAQAGQGKSVLATQFLDHLGMPFAWYQIGPEDRDTVLFLGTLLTCLKETLPHCESPLLDEILQKGEASPAEASRLGKILLEDLAPALRSEFFLVLDDIHLLEDSAPSLELIECLLANAPPRLRLILISRHPVSLKARPATEILTVGGDDLALSKSETAELFSQLLESPLSTKEVAELHRLTEGWIMGLLMVGQSLHAGADLACQGRLEAITLLSQREVFDFFRSEVLAGFSPPLRRTLLKLSLLENIPLPVVMGLGEVDDIKSTLEFLVARNFFLRRLDEHGNLYGFHHLLRDALRAQAEKELTLEERTEILLRAGHWFKEQERPEEAIRYYLHAGDCQFSQDLLFRFGIRLLASNRIITLSDLLDKIPNSLILGRPWLSYFRGVVYMDTDPTKAEPYLRSSYDNFVSKDDTVGILMSGSQLIYYHLTIDGKFNKVSHFLEIVERLFLENFSSLNTHLKIMVSTVIAAGSGFYGCDLKKMDKYADLSLSLAESHDLKNLSAPIRVVFCYLHLFNSQWQNYKKEIEKSIDLLAAHEVGFIQKLYLQTSFLNLLFLSADHINYGYQKEFLESAIENSLIAKSMVGPWLLIWDINFAIFSGNLHSAAQLTIDGLQRNVASGKSHPLSLILQFQAYVHSLDNHNQEAESLADESTRLRKEAGGEHFIILNEMVVGATYKNLRLYDKAQDHLESAIRRSEKVDEMHIRTGAYLHLASLFLEKGDRSSASRNLEVGLHLLKTGGVDFFWSWTPTLMEPLLTFAVVNGIEADYARNLGAKRLGIVILEDGAKLPLLKIRALGTFEMEVGGRIVVRQADLSAAQRELLAFLLAAPGLQLPQEELQGLLWPEASSEKARRSLDTLLFRLRATLDPLFAPHSIRNYLILSKGVLRLSNCWVDAREFAEKAREGLAHVRRKEYWQAGNAFRIAHRLWQGTYLPGRFGELTGGMQEELERLFLDSAEAWGRILADGDRIEEGIEVLERALKLDRTCHELVKNLYDLHIRSRNPVKAKMVIRDYRRALEREEYPPEEIEEIMELLWEGAEPGPQADAPPGKIFVRDGR